jgi:hypothetical protein
VPRLFALDQNFPQPIVAVLDDYMTEAELVPIEQIDPRMSTLDDWEILLALHHHDRAWAGLVTTDSDMLALPREMAVLCQTKLTLVVTEEAGHDPLKATGLVLSHLPGICQRTDPERAQLWVLRTTQRPAQDPWERLGRIAERRSTSAAGLYDDFKLTVAELGRDPLSVD